MAFEQELDVCLRARFTLMVLCTPEEERVNSILAGLSPDQRSVVLLRAVGDLSVEQVGDVLGKTPRTVKRLQRQGLAALTRQGNLGTNTEDRARPHPELDRDGDAGHVDELRFDVGDHRVAFGCVRGRDHRRVFAGDLTRPERGGGLGQVFELAGQVDRPARLAVAGPAFRP